MTGFRGVSWFNVCFVALMLGGGAVLFVAGKAGAAVFMLLAGVWTAVEVRRSLRGRGTDASRVNTVQPYDERERAASLQAFAVTGMVAALWSFVWLIVGIARDDSDLLNVVLVVLLSLTYAVASSVNLRRA